MRLKLGHTSVRPGFDEGHIGHAVSDVFTMVRSPAKRKASAAVHQFQGCRWGPEIRKFRSRGTKKTKQVSEILCAALAGDDPKAHQDAEETVMAYVRCISGCMANMISGQGRCSRLKPDSEKARISKLEVAKAKLSRFAFVGVTERWNESMCLFAKLFPREGGKAYPEDRVNRNYRPSLAKSCEDLVEDVWRKNGYRDEEDEEVYAYAVQRFEHELANYPECKSGRRMSSGTSSELLL